MAIPTFTDLLRTAVAAMQAAHPERLGEIARAHAAIVEGHVVPVDADNGLVLSRNGHAWYAVNGTCDCQAGSFGKPCRHLQAWKLYRHIQQQHEALLLQDPAPAPPTPPVETEPATTPPAALPEAPVSITLRATLHGHEVLVTLRGTDFASVQAQVEQASVWAWSQAPTPEPTARPEGWCTVHHTALKLNHGKDGRTWLSHKTPDGRWCKGK